MDLMLYGVIMHQVIVYSRFPDKDRMFIKAIVVRRSHFQGYLEIRD